MLHNTGPQLAHCKWTVNQIPSQGRGKGELWKCKRNENVFKVTTTTRAANLHNPEQQIVTNWKLFSAKIVSDCLCKPSPPPSPPPLCAASHFALFHFSFSLLLLSPVPVAIVIIKVAQITRKIQQLKLTARQYENQPHTQREADTDTDRMEEHSRRYVARVQTKKYRQVWRFMALFSAAHFAKNVFQLSHNCAICRVFYVRAKRGAGGGRGPTQICWRKLWGYVGHGIFFIRKTCGKFECQLRGKKVIKQ